MCLVSGGLSDADLLREVARRRLAKKAKNRLRQFLTTAGELRIARSHHYCSHGARENWTLATELCLLTNQVLDVPHAVHWKMHKTKGPHRCGPSCFKLDRTLSGERARL